MSRLVSLLIVLLAIAVATPVLAGDKTSLGGEMRVGGWYFDDDSDSTSTIGDQRLRVQGTFKANEMVSATFRADFSEGDWGSAANGRLSRLHTEMDRAFMTVKFDAFTLTAGTQYYAFGKTTAVIANNTGLMVKTKGPMPVTVFGTVLDDNDDSTDAFLTGVNVNFAKAYDVFLAYENNGAEESVYMLGAAGSFDLDAFKLMGEINFVAGDSAVADRDAVGLQIVVDGSMGVTEMIRVGGALMYAQGSDKADEVVYTRLGNAFGSWDPLGRGPLADERLQVGGMPYGIFGANAGFMGGQVYADVKLADALSLHTSLAFAQPSEDSVTAIDDVMVGNLGVNYKVMDNVVLASQAQYASFSGSAAVEEDLITFGTRLKVSF